YQHFKINPSGKLLYQPVGAVTGTIAQSSGSVNNGQWRQVVAVLNSPTVNLYIDGAPDGSGTLGGSMTSLHTEFGSMRAFGNPLYQPYTGLMDDVAVWNTALTAGKVRSLSTITAVLGDYSASKMDKLFQVYDGTLGSYNDGTRTWQKVTGLTEHSAGEAWTDGSTCHVQFDAAGAGVSSSGGSAYASWAATNGASGQTLAQDHDHDGVANGIEYFLGGPNGNTTGFTPLPGVVNTAGTRSVTWTHAADYAGVHGTDYVVQTSATLADGSWTDETLGVTVTISGNHLTYTFPAGDERTFARLMVTGP
ncbi:MAG: hypothetical protein NTW21_38405, partial [Verrucomicrobia bacterium]|nr:hypothetical protein [Verrucomicrobiota bacterium]